MELAKYDLQPQEQLVVSLYLKSMNKAQSARDAGYGSPSVFNKPPVKAAIAEQLSIRAERLRIGGDWVLMELKRVYDLCMQIQETKDVFGQATGEFKFDAANAIKALNLIGKHVDVRAFEPDVVVVATDLAVMERLVAARKRCSEQDSLVNIECSPVEIEELPFEDVEVEDEPEISFMRPPSYSDAVADISEPDALVTDDEKLSRLMEHWRTNPRNRCKYNTSD